MKEKKLQDHRDRRGFVVNPFEHLENTGDITNCHAFTIEPGCSRGDHVHHGRNEQVLVLSGEIRVSTPDNSIRLYGDVPSLLTIPHGVSHVFHNAGKEPAIVLCWSDSRKPD